MFTSWLQDARRRALMPAVKPKVAHYDRSKIQPIDYMAESFTPEEYAGYLKGNVLKYLARYKFKGHPLDDLRKARVYLDWLIEREGGGKANG